MGLFPPAPLAGSVSASTAHENTHLNQLPAAGASLYMYSPRPTLPLRPQPTQGDGSNLLEEFIAHPGVKVMPAVHQYETHPLNVMDAMSETCRGAGELGAPSLARPPQTEPLANCPAHHDSKAITKRGGVCRYRSPMPLHSTPQAS